MTPDVLAKSNTEHAHQRAFFAWLAFASYRGFEQAKEWAEGSMSNARLLHPGHTDRVHPELMLMHAIPNGGYRNKSEAGKLKAEGVKAGVLDTFLPVPKGYVVPGEGAPEGQAWHATYNGLYVEFKDPKRKNHKEGGLSQAQIDFGEGVRGQGYCVRVAYTWREAANVVMLYYGVELRFDT